MKNRIMTIHQLKNQIDRNSISYLLKQNVYNDKKIINEKFITTIFFQIRIELTYYSQNETKINVMIKIEKFFQLFFIAIFSKN